MIRTKEMEREDLEAVARLEQEIFPDAWSVKGLEETFAQKQALILGAWIEEALAGYVIFYHVLDEGEIARIAAAPWCRNQGVGSALFGELEERCRHLGVGRLLLEVREGNETARCFYASHGFKEDGRRKNFYEDPVEDAVLMSKELTR